MKPTAHLLRPRFAGLALFLTLIAGSARADYQSTVQSYSPLGYWRFNETVAAPGYNTVTNAGTLGSAVNGYAVGTAIKGQPGIEGNCVRFTNPSNNVSVTVGASKIDVPFNVGLNPNTPFSVEFWAKASSFGFDNSAGFSPVCNIDPNLASVNRSGWLFYLNNVGRWNFRLGNTSGTVYDLYATSGFASTNVWQHIVATYDGTNANLYVNGSLVGTIAAPGASWVRNTSSFLRIGATALTGNGSSAPFISQTSNNGNRGFDGWVDELAIYTNILSAATIAQHFAATNMTATGYHATVLSNSPAGYWTMDEPVATPPASLPVGVNSGGLGSAADGTNQWGSLAGQSGPPYAGMGGAANKAVSFDGRNGYFQVKDEPSLQITGTLTMMAWVKPAEKDFFHDIMVRGLGGYNPSTLGFEGETFLRISRGSGTGTGTYYEVGSTDGTNYYNSVYCPLPAGDVGNWVFVAGTYDGTSWNLYRNGVFIGSVVGPGPTTLTNRWTIGSRSDPPAGQSMFFSGSIDEPAILNTALSASDIATIYNSAQVPPVITAAPQVTTTLYNGDSVSLSVWAEGSPTLSYRWLSNSVATGVTATNITLNGLTTGTKTISVIVTNIYGAATSSVTFVVQPGVPVITQQPQSVTRYVGYPFSVSVTAGGSAPLTYYWKQGATVVQAGPLSTYTNTASMGLAGTYSCLVSNAFGTALSSNAIVTVLPLPTGYSDAVLGTAPIAYWRLDESSGTVAHDVINGYDGTYNSTTLGVPGYSTLDANTAATFSGVNSYVGGINGTAINFFGYQNFTIEAWVKASPGQAEGATIIAKGNGPNGQTRSEQFALDVAGGVYRFFTAASDTQLYSVFANVGPNGSWQHVVAVYDTTNALGNGYKMYIYVNGELQGMADSRFAGLNFSTTPVAIGSKRSGVSPNYDSTFNGSIDEVAIYSMALDSSTIGVHYGAGYGTTVAPQITVQPVSTTNYVGLQATLVVNAVGSQPLKYFWKKGGLAIPEADVNSNFLVLPGLVLTNAGTYSVLVSNAVGVSNSVTVGVGVLSAPVTAPALAGLVLHLTFDNSLSDTSGRSNNATAIHTMTGSSNVVSPTYVLDGALGQAFHYETAAMNTGGKTSIATDASYATLGIRPDLQFGTNTSFTVAYWIRLPANYTAGDLPFFTDAAGSTGNRGFVFAPAYGIGTADENPDPLPDHYGTWADSIGDGTEAARYYGDLGTLFDGGWHHLVHVIDRSAGTTVTYLDGLLANAQNTTGFTVNDAGNITSGYPATIGQDPTGYYGETGSGDIDDLGVWRRALTPLEAASIYIAATSNQLSYVNATVTLSIQSISSTQIRLIWPAGVLQSADNVQGPYTDVSGAVSPATITVGTRKFYRVRL